MQVCQEICKKIKKQLNILFLKIINNGGRYNKTNSKIQT